MPEAKYTMFLQRYGYCIDASRHRPKLCKASTVVILHRLSYLAGTHGHFRKAMARYRDCSLELTELYGFSSFSIVCVDLSPFRVVILECAY